MPSVRLFEEDAAIGVVHNAVIVKHHIAGLFNIQPVFFAVGNVAASNFDLGTLQDDAPVSQPSRVVF